MTIDHAEGYDYDTGTGEVVYMDETTDEDVSVEDCDTSEESD